MADGRQEPRVPDGVVEAEHEIRKSRFLAYAAPAATREEALAAVDAMRHRYPDASHHCYAYQLGGGGQASAGMSDDGEPSGTAGKPILNGIQHKGIGDVVVVVSRYFGGVRLGAGGLVRAYAAATEAALAALPLRVAEHRVRQPLRMDFAHEQPLRHWAAQHEATLEDVAYGEGVFVTLLLSASHLDALARFCAARGLVMESPDG